MYTTGDAADRQPAFPASSCGCVTSSVGAVVSETGASDVTGSVSVSPADAGAILATVRSS